MPPNKRRPRGLEDKSVESLAVGGTCEKRREKKKKGETKLALSSKMDRCGWTRVATAIHLSSSLSLWILLVFVVCILRFGLFFKPKKFHYSLSLSLSSP